MTKKMHIEHTLDTVIYTHISQYSILWGIVHIFNTEILFMINSQDTYNVYDPIINL